MKKTDFKQMAQAYRTIIILLVIIIIFGVLEPTAFLTLKNFIDISRQMTALTIISIGATMVVVVNEFDLSMGSMANLGGVIAALMAVAGILVGASFLLTVLVCMVVGWVNGYIVVKFKVLSSITTLGISTVLDDLVYRLTSGATVFESIPKSFTWLGTSKIGGIPFLSVLMILFVLALASSIKHTPSGRKMYAIGGGEEASRIVGINVKTYKILAFMLCGALTGGMGIAVASRVGLASTSAEAGYFLQSYAAAYIGCTISRQGIPNVAGALVDATILLTLANGLTILQMSSYMQNTITGIIIVVAVIAQKLGRGDAK